MSIFYVVHKDINGVELGEVSPANLKFGWSLDAPGYITYDIPIMSPSYYPISMAHYTKTTPYKTDFHLRDRSGQWYMGGFHTEISAQDFQYSKSLSVAGKDYLYYLDRNFWPKDPMYNYRTSADASVDPTNGTVFTQVNETISSLVVKLIYQAINDAGLSANWPVTNGYTFAFSGGFPTPGIGSYSYRIDPGDTRSVREHINEILALNTTGTNYYIRLDQFSQIPLTGAGNLPTYGISDPVVWKFNADGRGGNCEVISFRHGGIRGTRLMAVAQGPSSKKAAFAQAGTSTYRRWDFTEEFVGTGAFNDLASLTAAASADALRPDIEIQIRFPDEPERTTPWIREILYPGVRVELTADMLWYQGSDTFTVTAMDAEVSDEAVMYTLTLNLPASIA